jgi:hypothetical protein
VEDAVLADLAAAMGSRFDARRFIPFVVMHEFEGLLFSDCAAFSRGIGRPDLEKKSTIHRLLRPEKPLLGALAILEIGLARIRAECPHFDGWVTRLEAHTLQLE